MENILELRDVTKIYPGGVLANYKVNFNLREGEIHALVGENGAGKSTMMKILYGMEEVTSGQIFLRGEPVRFGSSMDAIQHGIGMVHQHFMLVDSFTAAENVMLGRRQGGPLVHRKQELEAVAAIAEQYKFDLDLTRRVRDMSVGMKQKLEILKILYQGAKVVILDEPTAVLTPQECEELFTRLEALKKSGMSIIFISHKLNEVKRISDRITVLRSGETKGTYNTADVTAEDISRLMVGSVVELDHSRPVQPVGDEVLRAENLYYRDSFGVAKLNGVCLNIREGEIVGVAGVEGNGQSELVDALTANLPGVRGKIWRGQQELTGKSVREYRESGIAHVPEDRMLDGCASTMSIQENLIASQIRRFVGKCSLLKKQGIQVYSRDMMRDFRVKATDEEQAVGSLSGGNIQKVIIARELSQDTPVLILAQPTRGVDIGAISFIHEKILEMRSKGKGILLVSADLNELVGLSDRILVMHKGEIVADLDNTQPVSEDELGLYMLGLKRQKEVM